MSTSEGSTSFFQDSDAWLLHAILLAAKAGDASLQNVIHMGDAINHSVFNYDELNGGVVRLLKAGLILQIQKTLKPTALAQVVWEQAKASGKDVYATTNSLKESLWRHQSPSGVGAAETSDTGFSREEFDASCTAYHEWFRDTLARLRRDSR